MKKRTKYMVLVVIVLSICLVMIYGVTFAKYASNSIWNHYLESKKFYFSSEQLAGDKTLQNTNYLWDGNAIHFTLMNTLGGELVTDYDISYQLRCEVRDNPSISCQINGTGQNTYKGVLSSYQVCINTKQDGVSTSAFTKTDCLAGGYEWQQQVTKSDFTLDFVSDKDFDSVTVDVTAVATAPYKKTLKGVFVLHRDQNLNGQVHLTYQDYDGYRQLVLSNSYSENKCVKVQWNPSDYLLDLDLEQVLSYETNTDGYINSMKVSLAPKSSVRYLFYPQKDGAIDSPFSLEEIPCE